MARYIAVGIILTVRIWTKYHGQSEYTLMLKRLGSGSQCVGYYEVEKVYNSIYFSNFTNNY